MVSVSTFLGVGKTKPLCANPESVRGNNSCETSLRELPGESCGPEARSSAANLVSRSACLGELAKALRDQHVQVNGSYGIMLQSRWMLSLQSPGSSD